MKKLSNIEADLKKTVAYQKTCTWEYQNVRIDKKKSKFENENRKKKQTAKQYSFERKLEKRHDVGMCVTWPLNICFVFCTYIFMSTAQ